MPPARTTCKKIPLLSLSSPCLLGGIFLPICPYLRNLRKSSWSKPVPSQEILVWKGSGIWVETNYQSTILPFAVLPKASNSASLALRICIVKMDMGSSLSFQHCLKDSFELVIFSFSLVTWCNAFSQAFQGGALRALSGSQRSLPSAHLISTDICIAAWDVLVAAQLSLCKTVSPHFVEW